MTRMCISFALTASAARGTFSIPFHWIDSNSPGDPYNISTKETTVAVFADPSLRDLLRVASTGTGDGKWSGEMFPSVNKRSFKGFEMNSGFDA
ncbi:hypothetical protein B0F90DRAFT_1729184 [Multifurca ochricompacta]|uniref:Uncharacterized protein n=1 Tax=Multifurca ochricompacta TaxID=376703 RepID=A0AAD4M2Q3_9AGAM|nr:hypothetical protein B0F90DRAFT_1729184 [Multifurca ochricompacta]